MRVYHYLDEAHKRIGITRIDRNKIPKDLKAKGYEALNFGGEKSKDTGLSDGSVVRLSANSDRAEQLRGPQSSGADGAYVNSGLVRELGRRTAPMPEATGAFILLSLNGRYMLASVPSCLLMRPLSPFTLLIKCPILILVNSDDGHHDPISRNHPGRKYSKCANRYHKTEFIQNLQGAGYRVTKSGSVTILENGTNRYVIYDVAKSTGGPSAAYSNLAKVRV